MRRVIMYITTADDKGFDNVCKALEDAVESGDCTGFFSLTDNEKVCDLPYHRSDLTQLAKDIAAAQGFPSD